MYKDFYKTIINICKSNKVINKYKENCYIIILNFKINIINNIIKAFNTNKSIITITLLVYFILFSELCLFNKLVFIPAINKIFFIRQEFSKSYN